MALKKQCHVFIYFVLKLKQANLIRNHLNTSCLEQIAVLLMKKKLFKKKLTKKLADFKNYELKNNILKKENCFANEKLSNLKTISFKRKLFCSPKHS
jgi:hypothetical protein